MKKILSIFILLLVILLSSCSLDITTFEENMKNNNYYVYTINENQLNVIYDNNIDNLKNYELNALPVIISIVSLKEITIDINKIESIDYGQIFDENFIGLAVEYSNFVNANVAYSVKDELIQSIKDNNEIDVNNQIFDLNIKKIGSTIYYGTDDFIKIIESD